MGTVVTEVKTEFLESSADLKVESLPLSHVSVELGHLYMEDLARGEPALRDTFAAVAPWVRAAEVPRSVGSVKQPVRISTCFLIDDYFSRFSTPAEVIPMVTSAAESEGLRIDYLARESACAQTRDSRAAPLVLGRLVTEPEAGATGGRPPLTETGWLTNGQRSPNTSRGEAMAKREAWRPPQESARRRHSIFVDIELWDERDGHKTWSCPMLAAVWQLARLGLLRHHGRTVIEPRPLPTELPDEWSAMPPVAQVEPNAAPFHGYQTLSLLDDRFLAIEHAVRVILNQVAQDGEVMRRVEQRALQEGMRIAQDVTGRVGYLFVTDF
jgi:hypothetical protein